MVSTLESDRAKISDATYLAEKRHDDGTVCKFPASQSTQRLLRGFWSVEFDVDLANAIRLSASTGWPWDLEIDDSAVLGTLFAHVLENFYCLLVDKMKLCKAVCFARSGRKASIRLSEISESS